MKKISVTVLLAALFLSAEARGALLPTGAPFPAWKLRDQTGAEVSSADLTGKTYLLWYYPKAMTPGCTAEGISLRDHYDDFRSLGVEVLGISFDSPEENARFAKEERFPFRLLSDDGTLAVAVGAADSSDQKTARRISYLVGPDGKVVRSYPSVKPADHAEELLQDLRSNKRPPS